MTLSFLLATPLMLRVVLQSFLVIIPHSGGGCLEPQLVINTNTLARHCFPHYTQFLFSRVAYF
jgi:hypothetical protein